MDEQIFKNQYNLDRIIVWLINPLEMKLGWFDPLGLGKKMIYTGKKISVPHPKYLAASL